MDKSKLYYFIHPYVSKNYSIEYTVDSCLYIMEKLSENNIKVFAPSVFFHFLYQNSNVSEDYLREIDGKILDKCDGAIISPLYGSDTSRQSIKSVLSYFKLNNLPVYNYRNIFNK